MQPFSSRGGRWPLALTFAALTALAGCADEPVAPGTPVSPNAAVRGLDPIEVHVTNTSGGTEVGSLRWAASQMVDWAGGAILIDSALGGKTITLDATLEVRFPTAIVGPRTGITISGKDQFQLIYSSSTLYLENLTLTKGNSPIGSAVETRQLEMQHTTVTDNRGSDGAIFVLDRGYIANSTVSGNVTSRGAVMYSGGADLRIANSTIAYNAQGGVGPYPLSGPGSGRVVLDNSIVSNNGSQNCATYHGLEYVGKNVVNDWSCADAAIKPSDPQLKPLANNGGPNMTHAIPHTSPACNAGFDCNFAPVVDQRYVARNGACDVGAFEFNDFTKVTITIDPTVRLDAGAGYVFLTGTMKCTRDDTIPLRLELRQEQRVGKEVVNVHTTATTQVACSPTTTTWGRKMFLTTGTWQTGAARATATTFYTPDWVTPASVASAVKIVRK